MFPKFTPFDNGTTSKLSYYSHHMIHFDTSKYEYYQYLYMDLFHIV